MTYEKACKILNLRYANDIRGNAVLARQIRRTLVDNAPLRFKVAISVIIKAVPVVRYEIDATFSR